MLGGKLLVETNLITMLTKISEALETIKKEVSDIRFEATKLEERVYAVERRFDEPGDIPDLRSDIQDLKQSVYSLEDSIDDLYRLNRDDC